MQNLSIQRLQELMKTVQTCFKGCEALCSGGAPRDILNKREVKDIDIFVYPHFTSMWKAGVRQFSEAIHCAPSPPSRTTNSADGFPFQVLDFKSGFMFYPVQIIRVEQPVLQHIQKTFDFGLSMVWVDSQRLRMFPEYWRDYHSRQITYVGGAKSPNAQQLESSRQRLARLKLKYPQWRFSRTGRLET